MENKYPSWCCQKCGAEIGWLGKFFEFIWYADLLGIRHKCKSNNVINPTSK